MTYPRTRGQKYLDANSIYATLLFRGQDCTTAEGECCLTAEPNAIKELPQS